MTLVSIYLFCFLVIHSSMSTLEAFCIRCLWYWRDTSKESIHGDCNHQKSFTKQCTVVLLAYPYQWLGSLSHITLTGAKSRVWNNNVVSVLIWCCQRDLRAVSPQHPFQNCSPTGIQTESLIHWTKTSNGKVQSWVIPWLWAPLFFGSIFLFWIIASTNILAFT